MFIYKLCIVVIIVCLMGVVPFETIFNLLDATSVFRGVFLIPSDFANSRCFRLVATAKLILSWFKPMWSLRNDIRCFCWLSRFLSATVVLSNVALSITDL